MPTPPTFKDNARYWSGDATGDERTEVRRQSWWLALHSPVPWLWDADVQIPEANLYPPVDPADATLAKHDALLDIQIAYGQRLRWLIAVRRLRAEDLFRKRKTPIPPESVLTAKPTGLLDLGLTFDYELTKANNECYELQQQLAALDIYGRPIRTTPPDPEKG